MIRPEEKVDNRTLYERLKSNADKKQEEHDEKFSLSKLFTATSVTPRTQTPLSSFFLCLPLPIFHYFCVPHTHFIRLTCLPFRSHSLFVDIQLTDSWRWCVCPLFFKKKNKKI